MRSKPLKMAASCFVAGALVASGCAADGNGDGPSGGVTLRYAGGNSEELLTTRIANQWMDDVEGCTDGEVQFDRYHSGSLIPATEVMPAIRSGRLDVGYVPTSYHVQELPLWEVVAVPFSGDNEFASMEAFTELYEENESFRDGFEQIGVHVVAFHPTGPAATLTSTPVDSIEDLTGMQLRAVGTIAGAFSHINVEPIAIDPGEMYEGIQRGVIDGVASLPFDAAPTFGIPEVAPYVTNTGVGTYSSSSIGINKDLWDGLSDEVQTCMNEAGDVATGPAVQEMASEANQAACAAVLEEGGSVTNLPESEIADWRTSAREEGIEEFVSEAAIASGNSEDEVRQFFDEYTSLYEASDAAMTYETGMRSCDDSQ